MRKALKKLDCTVCKTDATMEATKVPKFGIILRVIGYFFVAPSLLGVLFSIILFFGVGMAASEVVPETQTDAEMVGAALGVGLGFGLCIFIGVASLAGGLIGWLLIMKTKVYKCLDCGYIISRA